jgi:hypothetical protein
MRAQSLGETPSRALHISVLAIGTVAVEVEAGLEVVLEDAWIVQK